MEKYQKEIVESLKKAEHDLNAYYKEFDSKRSAEIQQKIQSALERTKENYANTEKDFSEMYSAVEMQHFERKLKEMALNLENHFEGFQDYLKEFGFNEFYYSKDMGNRRIAVIRKETNGEVSYAKRLGRKLNPISKAEIAELDTVFGNGANATGNEIGDVISIDSSISNHTKDGKKTNSHTVKNVKKFTGGY